MKFRELTRDERTTLYRALDRWGVFEFFNDKAVVIAEGTPKKVCLISADIKPIVSKFEPEYAGLEIGELQKGFTPGVQGADLFARHAKNNQFYVAVNENAEQLVLYGRDVMGDSITLASESLDENQLVIIMNARKEAIGVGRTRFAGKSILQKGRITVTTIADAGSYLRDEG
ncbi:MAG: PUA domain-containing protein [Nitrososphaera sp.]